jgi:transcriptional regulator NrdR family protein
MTKKPRKTPKRVRGGASVPCPQCGNQTQVLDTRRGTDGQVQRLRRCLHCRNTFGTVEVPS